MTVDSAQYAGVITVRAQNEAGMVETSANLVAAETTADVPQIIAGLNDISATEGDRLKISVSASNATKIEWSLNKTVVHVRDTLFIVIYFYLQYIVQFIIAPSNV